MLNIPKSLNKFRTTVPGAGEVVDWVLYDTQRFDGGAQSLDYFLTTSTSKLVSNMKAAGQMPGNEAFVLRGLGVSIRPNLNDPTLLPTVTDVQNIIDAGVLRLNIGSKSYNEYPLYLLPDGSGASGIGFTNVDATDIQTACNGVPDPRNVYALSKPLVLEPSLSFNARIEWVNTVVLTATFAVRVMLFGEIARPIQ